MYPLYAVPLAANRVKIPGLVTLGVGLANLMLALLLTRVFGWGLLGLAGAGAVTLTLQHLLFIPLYAAHILNRPYRTFYLHYVSVAVAAGFVIGSCWLIQWISPVSTWLQLAAAGLGVSVVYAILVYFLLPAEERQVLKKAIWERKPSAA
jgi:membrane protein EpsK